jgi:hypothetical protein
MLWHFIDQSVLERSFIYKTMNIYHEVHEGHKEKNLIIYFQSSCGFVFYVVNERI